MEAFGFLFRVHKHSNISVECDINLSNRRVNFMARIAQHGDKCIVDVRGFGECHPNPSNATGDGRALNRCVKVHRIR